MFSRFVFTGILLTAISIVPNSSFAQEVTPNEATGPSPAVVGEYILVGANLQRNVSTSLRHLHSEFKLP